METVCSDLKGARKQYRSLFSRERNKSSVGYDARKIEKWSSSLELIWPVISCERRSGHFTGVSLFLAFDEVFVLVQFEQAV